jgi:hypothetical protein
MGLITKTHFQYYNNSQKFTATAGQTEFPLTLDPLPASESEFIVRINGSEVDDNLYGYSPTGGNAGKVIFTAGRTAGDILIIELINRKHGDYRYISLINIINNYMMVYVGDGKLIPTCKRTEVLFHAKRGIQEFAYDIARVEKIQEIEVSPSLSVPMPQDYVHYVRLSSVDAAGIEHIIYPSRYSSNPSQSILQDDDYNYLFDNDDSLLTGFPVTQDRFNSFDHTNLSGDLQDENLNYSADRSAERMFNYGERFGLDPELSQKNGVFIVDELNGKFTFSSELSGKVITIKYISDGLGTDDEMKVHKYAEDAIYKYITHALASGRANFPEYIINRFRKERRAAMRNAKIRLSSYKISELEQVMRGKSKRIKN